MLFNSIVCAGKHMNRMGSFAQNLNTVTIHVLEMHESIKANTNLFELFKLLKF